MRFQKGIRKAPPNTADNEGGETCQYKSKCRRKEGNRFLSRMLQGVWKTASGSDSCKATPLSRMLIREDDASSIMRLRIRLGPPMNRNAAVLAGVVPRAPPMYVDFAPRGFYTRATRSRILSFWRRRSNEVHEYRRSTRTRSEVHEISLTLAHLTHKRKTERMSHGSVHAVCSPKAIHRGLPCTEHG